MKRFFIYISLIIASHTVYAEYFSVSLDPITFLGMLVPSTDKYGEQQPTDVRNMWLAMELNIETPNARELGFGIIARMDRVALRAQYRSFFNKDRQSGIFWGLFGHVEWRQMYWLYDKENELNIGWGFPFLGNDNVFHSIGITCGIDTGFRIRGEKIGVTPFIGLGIPVFYCFGYLPPKKDKDYFHFQNIVFRAIDIGVRIDVFL